MSDTATQPPPFVLIARAAVERDAGPADNKLGKENNNGRKIFATQFMPELGETVLADPLWRAPAVLPTGEGGLEVATFTEFTGQDRHKHRLSTEIYTVLKGTMLIYINDAGPYELKAMDEVVILPGTVHEIVQGKRRPRAPDEAFDLMVRVHALNCSGVRDKYVQFEPGGEWHRWGALTKADRARAYKKQA